MKRSKLVITKYASFVEYLKELGLIRDGEYETVQYATPANVTGRHVIGVIPLFLCALADRVTEVRVNVPRYLRGTELTLEQVRQFGIPPITYRVTMIEGEESCTAAGEQNELDQTSDNVAEST